MPSTLCLLYEIMQILISVAIKEVKAAKDFNCR